MANSARYNDHFRKMDPTEVYPEIVYFEPPHITALRANRLTITKAPTLRDMVKDFDEAGRRIG